MIANTLLFGFLSLFFSGCLGIIRELPVTQNGQFVPIEKNARVALLVPVVDFSYPDNSFIVKRDFQVNGKTISSIGDNMVRLAGVDRFYKDVLSRAGTAKLGVDIVYVANFSLQDSDLKKFPIWNIKASNGEARFVKWELGQYRPLVPEDENARIYTLDRLPEEYKYFIKLDSKRVMLDNPHLNAFQTIYVTLSALTLFSVPLIGTDEYTLSATALYSNNKVFTSYTQKQKRTQINWLPFIVTFGTFVNNIDVASFKTIIKKIVDYP